MWKRQFRSLVRPISLVSGLRYGLWVTLGGLVTVLLWTGWYANSDRALSGKSLILFGLQWPYSYDSCDVGTLKNQTYNGLPLAATVNGDDTRGGALSYLPGQRLSRCTCPGEDHPGPKHADGTFVGRAAPEIDIFEAEVFFVLFHTFERGLLTFWTRFLGRRLSRVFLNLRSGR